MDLVNIVYRYINRFITSDELINLLENIDKSKFSKEEVSEIEACTEAAKQIVANIPIEIDEVEQKRISVLDNILESLEKAVKNESNSKEIQNFAEKQYNELVKSKTKKRDSGPRYEKIYDLLVNNQVYISYCKKMTDLELLEFITQYISAPVTPNIDQETFDDLVKVGIKEDKRESLWRLAFNYCGKKKDFTKIEDYFIEKRDSYYLTELIYAVESDLNIKRLVDKVINTKDKDFIIECGREVEKMGLFTDEEIKKLKERINKDVLNNL